MSAVNSWHWAGREFAGCLVMLPPGPAPSPFGFPQTRDDRFQFEWAATHAEPFDLSMALFWRAYAQTIRPPTGIILNITDAS